MNTTQNTSYEHLVTENRTLKNQVDYLNEQLEWFKKQIFGQKSERVVTQENPHQLLIPGYEDFPPEEEQKETVPAHTRRKPRRNGQDKIQFSPDMPVETTVLDIQEEKKICKETGIPLVQIGEETTHKLAHKPGSYYIKKIIRPKYAHPKKEEAGIQTADLPETLLPRCYADESLLAEIVTKKFADHLPLYRVEEILKRGGIKISRKLLSQWVIKVGKALKPLFETMKQEILSKDNIFIDETPVKLQAKGKCKQVYMWVVVGGEGADPPYRIYEFKQDRTHKNVPDIIEGYNKILHSDKYGAYQTLAEQKKIIWCPCYAHIRRKFFEAESGDPELRKWIIMKIRHLFLLEKVAWSREPEERLEIRKKKEIPIIDELIETIKKKLEEGKLLPKSKLREALNYTYGLIPYLKNHTKHPFARLDNNVAERAIRPLAIGRKNWLFIGSPNGGEAAAILYSLVQTCRGLKINPRDYLEDIMRRLMSHNSQKLHELLPDYWLKEQQSNILSN